MSVKRLNSILYTCNVICLSDFLNQADLRTVFRRGRGCGGAGREIEIDHKLSDRSFFCVFSLQHKRSHEPSKGICRT